MPIIHSSLITEWAAASLAFFLILALFGVVALVMVGTLEHEARPVEAAVTWMRIYRARHGRRGRRSRAQWDIQLAHAGGRYQELPTVAEYDTDTLRLFHDLNNNTEDTSPPGVLEPPDARPEMTQREGRTFHGLNNAHTSIFDRLSDTDCFAAINWDIHRAVNELAVLQRDLWAGYKLPPWKKWKR